MSHRKSDNYLYGGSASSRFQSRPRSLTTHFGSSPNVLGSPMSSYNALNSMYGHSPGGYRMNQSYSPYTSSFGRSSAGIYGGTSSGYGGVYLPSHQTLSSLNLMSPYLRDYDKKTNSPMKRYNWKGNKWKDALREAANSIPSPSTSTAVPLRSTNSDARSKSRTDPVVERKTRAPSRSHSFNKERSSSASSLGRSGLTSRSTSLVSLASDGYCSGTDSKEDAGSKRVSNSDTPTENGAIDYKVLWEASQVEVKKLKELMKTNDQQLRDARATIERVTHVSQNSLTELEKREKRAMERKLSEMEEELKLQQALQAENQRLKDENGALIRVISKLSK